MAPKGAPPNQVDEVGRFGVFVNIGIPQLKIELHEPLGPTHPATSTSGGAPPTPDSSLQVWPELHLEATHPSSHARLVGTHTRVSEDQDGSYALNFIQKFRMEPTMEALHELINNPLTLELRDTPTTTLLATAVLDLLPFGLGEQALAVAELPMAIDSAAAEAAEMAAVAAAARPASQGKRVTSGRGGARNSPPTTLPRLASPPRLAGLNITLTHREAPEGTSPEALVAAAASSPSLTSSAESPLTAKPGPPKLGGGRAGGRGAGDHHEVVVDESLLPPLEPFRYLPEGVSDPHLLNVLEFKLDGPSKSLPPGLLGAHEAAGGRLSFVAGLTLPPPCPPVVLQGGVVQKEDTEQTDQACITWPHKGQLRQVLKPEAAHAILEHLDKEGELCVEIARYVEPDKTMVGDSEAAWHAYHGLALLPDADVLLEGGINKIGKDGVTEAKLGSWVASQHHDAALPSVLPAYSAPPGKFKPVEELNFGQPLSVHDRKLNKQPSSKQDRSTPADGSTRSPLSSLPAFSAWESSGTTISVGLQFARNLLPAWEPPAAPAKKLQDFIPQRDLNPPPPPVTCDDDFRVQVSAVLSQLAAAYLDVNAKHDQGQVDPVANPLEANKKLVKSLNKSGQYMAMRDGLKAAIVHTVQERFHHSGSMSPNEMSETYGPLYSHLVEIAHSVVNKAAPDSPPPLPSPEPSPPPGELAALAVQALEAEAAGDIRRSTALMRRRLLDLNNAQVHVEAAVLASRTGDLAYALTLLHTAIEINPSHQHALAAASMLHLDAAVAAAAAEGSKSGGIYPGAREGTDGGDAYTHWTASLACADALLGATQGSSEGWVTLALVHKNSSVAGTSADTTDSPFGSAAHGAEPFPGPEGAGNFGLCIAELKHRLRRACKVQRRSTRRRAQQRGSSFALKPMRSIRWKAGAESKRHGEESTEQSTVNQGAAEADSPEQGEHLKSIEPQQGQEGEREQMHGQDVPLPQQESSVGLGPAAPIMAETSRRAGVEVEAEGGEPSIASVGVMGVWQLLLDLGLRGLAEQAHELATTVFMRSSSLDPMALALSVARTHMLPTQPHFHHLGVHSSALQQQQQQQQQQDRSPAELIAAGVNQSSPSVETGGAPAPAWPTAQGRLADADFASALRALCTAKRMAEDQSKRSSTQPIGWEASLGAADEDEDEDEGLSDRAGCLPVLPLVLIGDLMWMAAGHNVEEGSAQRSADGSRNNQERRREARMAYQKVVEVVAAAGAQGNKYGPDGSLPAAASRSASLLNISALTPASSLETGAALRGGDRATGVKHPGVPGMEPWLLVRAHLRLGQSFLEDEAKAQCAMDVCAAAVALCPTSVAAWKGAAQAAQSLGNRTAARAAWAQANILDTEDGQTWAALATLDLREGRKQEAVQAIHKALALTAAVAGAPLTCTACPAEDEGGLLVEAALAASKTGDLLEASNWLHQALDLGHHTFEVYEQLAQVQAGRHDLLGSRTYAQKAGDLARTETQRQAADALQHSTSLKSHLRQNALGVSS